MNGILFDCGVRELDLNSCNTYNVTSMVNMFSLCTKLEKVNVQNWNASNFEDMGQIFFTCPKLHKLDLSNFKPPNLKTGEMMFGEDSIYDLEY